MATDVERMFEDYLAAWNSHDVEKIASFFTDDCVYEDVAVGAVSRGKEELKALTSKWSRRPVSSPATGRAPSGS